ncbi:hypothetical protein BDQ12DRAFT_688267 [Crucibulum laeve]|uniref:TERF2-interacting telomeric protein 1 Myb domain-containing protein n=1 Tax=Crucibulum laeve TaxID=68775 RepID=A0A5C3LSE5_9AGAR|nr:hypothetical protein BDQ12DRAFT_688267 [Crucibulum laeve]
MSSQRRDYTERDDWKLVEYIAINNPGLNNRTGNNLYKTLEENAENKWPWSRRHSWQSWRERYKKNQAWFDKNIKRYQRENGIEQPKNTGSPRERRIRVEFTPEDDKLLIRWIAKHMPAKVGRMGNEIYADLERSGEQGSRHTVHSWRQRYIDKQSWFDAQILKFQKKRDMPTENPGYVNGARSQGNDDDPEPRKRKRAKESNGEVKEKKRLKVEAQGDNRGEGPSRVREKRTSAGKAAVRGTEVQDDEDDGGYRQSESARPEEKEDDDKKQEAERLKKEQERRLRHERRVERRRQELREEAEDKMRRQGQEPTARVETRQKTQIPAEVRAPEQDREEKKEEERHTVKEEEKEEEDEAEEEDEEDEETRGPVGSDDYHGELFQDEGDGDAEVDELDKDQPMPSVTTEEDDEAEVNAALTDMEEAPDDPRTYDNITDGDQSATVTPRQAPRLSAVNEYLHPDIGILSSSHFVQKAMEEPYMPGGVDDDIRKSQPPRIKEEEAVVDLFTSQEPTPPVSGMDEEPGLGDTTTPRHTSRVGLQPSCAVPPLRAPAPSSHVSAATTAADFNLSHANVNSAASTSRGQQQMNASSIPRGDLSRAENLVKVDISSQASTNVFKESPPQATLAAAPPLTRSKPQLKRRRQSSEDPFAPLTPPADQEEELPQTIVTKRTPPILQEGPFRVAFKRRKRVVESSDSEEEARKPAWPPVRMKGALAQPVKANQTVVARAGLLKDVARSRETGKEVVFNASKTIAVNVTPAEPVKVEKMSPTNLGSGKGEANEDTLLAASTGKEKTHYPANSTITDLAKLSSEQTTKRATTVNAVASSSRIMLPPSVHVDASHRRSALEKSPAPPQAPALQQLASTSAHVPMESSVSRRVDGLVGDQSDIKPAARPQSTTSTATRSFTNADSVVERVGLENPNVVSAFLANTKVTSRPSIESFTLHKTKSSSKISGGTGLPDKGELQLMGIRDDPFLVGKMRQISSAERRHTTDRVTSEQLPPHIDLRQEVLSKRKSRKSLPTRVKQASSNSAYAPDSRHSTPSSITSMPSAEQELIALRGLRSCIEQISKEQGFTIEVIQKLFNVTKSLEKTEKLARKMRVKAEILAQTLLHKEGFEPSPSPEPEPAIHYQRQLSSSSSNRAFSGSSRRQSRKHSLQFKVTVDDDQVSDYSPPDKSRAGQFNRLVQQGRKHEALKREARRASGTHLPMGHQSSPEGSPVQEAKVEQDEQGDRGYKSTPQSSPMQPQYTPSPVETRGQKRHSSVSQIGDEPKEQMVEDAVDDGRAGTEDFVPASVEDIDMERELELSVDDAEIVDEEINPVQDDKLAEQQSSSEPTEDAFRNYFAAAVRENLVAVRGYEAICDKEMLLQQMLEYHTRIAEGAN